MEEVSQSNEEKRLYHSGKEGLVMFTESHQKQDYALTTRILIASGAVGPILLMLALLIEGATRSSYDAWTMAGSALSLSDQGWMQITNFIISGLLIVGFAAGLRLWLRRGQGGAWGPILIVAVGVGLILAGIFVTDPTLGYPPGTPPGPTVHMTLNGALHWYLGGLVVFSALPAACFVLARRFASDAHWKGWTLYSVITGILMVAFFVAFVIASMHEGLAGLWERISLGFGMVWMALVALRILSEMRSSTTSS
jgi:Protein of unknown function (DUF998)